MAGAPPIATDELVSRTTSLLTRYSSWRGDTTQVSVTGAPTGGTFRLAFRGASTAPIAYNADAPTVQALLEALPAVGIGNVVVAGGPLPKSPLAVTFVRALAAARDPVTAPEVSLTGGGPTQGVQVTRGTPDLGSALVRIFARMAGVVADRVNAVPDKNFLEFLDVVGARLRPPEAARVPVTFQLAAGTTVDALVPERTQVAAPPREGETQPTVYETERELVATPALLERVVSREPRDLATDHGLPDGTPFDPFRGTTPIPHTLYVGRDTYAAPLTKTVFLDVAPAPDSPGWLDAIEWSYWDGGAWSPVGWADATEAAGLAPIGSVPAVPPSTIGGTTTSWLRGRLRSTIPQAPSESDTLGQVAIVESATVPEGFAGSTPLRLDRPFSPFPTTELGSKLWLSSGAFDKPGAIVTISVALDPTHPTVMLSGFQLGWFGADIGGPTLGVSSAGDDGSEYTGTTFRDTTYALTQSGTITFRVPAGWSWTVGPDGTERPWLVVWAFNEGAGEGAAAYTADGLPRIESLTLSYRWPLPRLTRLRTAVGADAQQPLLADAAFVDQTPLDLNRDFLPFGDTPGLNSTFYLASEEAFAATGAEVHLSVTLTNEKNQDVSPRPAAPQNGLALAWEYWNGATWADLGANDGTARFTTGAKPVVFFVPGDAAAVDVNGQTRRWIRVRISQGDYGHPARYDPDATTGYKLVPSTLRPPSIRSLALGYRYRNPTEGSDLLDGLVAENDFEQANLTAAVHDEATLAATPLLPFTPPDDDRPALYLGFDRAFSNRPVTLYVSLAPALYDADAVGGAPERPAVVWEYRAADGWLRLETRDETKALTVDGLVTFVGPADFARSRRGGHDLFWLRVRWDRGTYETPPRVVAVVANTTWAVNAATIVDETLGSGTGEPGQVVRTARAPVLAGERIEVHEPEQPPPLELARLAEELGDDPLTVVRDESGAIVEVRVRWHEVLDFNTSGARDRHYVLDRLTGEIRFGGDTRGLPPPQGRGNIRARQYRTGGGAGGNRDRGEVALLQTAVPFVAAVSNPDPADGGATAETLADVVVRGPRLLRHGGRAIAAADFEDLAYEASREVARALAVPASGRADAGRVVLVIVPRRDVAQPAPTLELIASVADYLTQRLTPTFDLDVVGPGWTRVTVDAEVAPVDVERATNVESAILARLGAFLHPLTGGTGEGWPFGRRPHRSDLVAVIEAVAGVDHVRRLSVDEEVFAPDPVAGASLVFAGPHRISMAGER